MESWHEGLRLCRTGFSERREEVFPLTKSALRAGLAAELELFEPLNSFALVGDNLRLPYQGNGHTAHGNNAKDENEADVGLVSRKAEDAPKPSHSKGSPSTQSDQPAFVWRVRVGSAGGNSVCLVALRQSRGQDFANEVNLYPTENRWFVKLARVTHSLIRIGGVQFDAYLRNIFPKTTSSWLQ